MLTMLNSKEIRLSILRGQIPAQLQVFRGSIRSGVIDGWKRYVWYAFAELILGPATVAWIKYFDPSYSSNLSGSFLYAVLFLLVGVIASCIAVGNARNFAIVLSPDGWLQFNAIQYNLPSMQRLFSYASIADVQLNNSFWMGGTYLVIRSHEGKMQKWCPSTYYARSVRMMMIQSILTDYAVYKRSFRECMVTPLL